MSEMSQDEDWEDSINLSNLTQKEKSEDVEVVDDSGSDSDCFPLSPVFGNIYEKDENQGDARGENLTDGLQVLYGNVVAEPISDVEE